MEANMQKIITEVNLPGKYQRDFGPTVARIVVTTRLSVKISRYVVTIRFMVLKVQNDHLQLFKDFKTS